MFDKILIANRGEIAVRVIRACREMGICSVATYSEADKQSTHVRLADQAVLLGPAPASESYLSIDRVIDAARRSGAQAVHPGYGFLSENAVFAQAVQEAGLVFIGPSPRAILEMGDKVHARELMLARGVPVVPGYEGADDNESMLGAADHLGYPVLIKAAAGGGGKAMRIVTSRDEMRDLLISARREAQNAFGDGHLFLEKYVADARHIEFQVLGDRQGHIVHLFERECSIQRRHQKIIEETPSPLLDDALRSKMGEAAVEAARGVGYENAGTVEFIVDPSTRAFYFLEMNTRLQVEHPITEMVTGLDLVHLQLRVASGAALPFSQEEITKRGHAIECRVYAEDPLNEFLPSTGRLLTLVEPVGPGIRVDSGIAEGDSVTTYYDPMLAKLIVSAESRADAIQRMLSALEQYCILGVTTNSEFLHAVVSHPEFMSGRATTTFIERHMQKWQSDGQAYLNQALIASALAETVSPLGSAGGGQAENDANDPWKRRDGFRLGQME